MANVILRTWYNTIFDNISYMKHKCRIVLGFKKRINLVTTAMRTKHYTIALNTKSNNHYPTGDHHQHEDNKHASCDNNNSK